MRFKYAAPRLSSNHFMRLLFASLAKEKSIIIDISKIVEKIYKFKEQSGQEQKYLFDDIEFRVSIDNIASRDINEGINVLQTFGLIGKFNPSYEKIIIYLTEENAEDILKDCDPDIRDAMQRLAKSFSGD
jgi:hypothetical protein